MTDMHGGLPVHSFADTTAFEAWLTTHGANATGLWLKLAKKGAPTSTLSKQDAIDAALCHGWIDGQIDRLDANYWLTRFTPRTARSKWSQNNRTRAIALAEAGRVTPAGLAQIEAAKADGRWDRAYAPASTADVPADLAAALAQNPKAAAFFATLTGANRYAVLYRIGAVKTAATRARKIDQFVAMLERGETLHG